MPSTFPKINQLFAARPSQRELVAASLLLCPARRR
jgi:hypothetical protein